MILETHPADRKLMVKAISELTGTPAVYMYTPTYAFQIGDITVNRNGTVSSENTEAITAIAPMLVENGWLDALPEIPAETPDVPADEDAPATTPPEADEPDTCADKPDSGEAEMEPGIEATSIRIYEPGWELYSLKNLIRILYTRQYLINRMLKMDKLYLDPEVIDVMNGMSFLCVSDLETMIHDEVHIGMIRGFNISGGALTLDLPYDETYPLRWMYYSQLVTAIIKQAKASRRTKAEKQEPANDKYMANAWLNRLGFGGANYKELRHALMAHLNGYAAFKDDNRMQRHKDRLAEQRRIKRELNEEAHGND